MSVPTSIIRLVALTAVELAERWLLTVRCLGDRLAQLVEQVGQSSVVARKRRERHLGTTDAVGGEVRVEIRERTHG